MASQPPQRPRRNASPRSGPMRAIVPFSLRQNNSPTRGISSSNGRRSSPGPIPNVSDNHKKHHRSPDQRASPERCPSSPGFKVEKPKAVRASPGPAIRRTSSLDTITAPYLSGQWPKEPSSTSSHGSSSSSSGSYEPTQMHQSTQTEDPDRPGSSHKRSSSLGSADNLKEKYKQQLRKQGSRQSSSTNQRASPVHGYHSYQQATPPSPSPGVYSGPVSARSSAISIPTASLKPPSPKILRGSVEGLNQEIEKLVLSGFELEEERIGEIEGHRAPIPGTSTMRSIDTQTPRETQEDSNSDGSGSQSPPSSSPSDRSRPSSGGSSSAGNGDCKDVKEAAPEGSPELTWGARISSSPSHNKSWQLTRDPPDGCEIVKTIDDPSPKHKSSDVDSLTNQCPDKMLYIPLKPSDSSAFCPLPNFPLADFKAFNIPPTVTTAVAQTQTHIAEEKH